MPSRSTDDDSIGAITNAKQSPTARVHRNTDTHISCPLRRILCVLFSSVKFSLCIVSTPLVEGSSAAAVAKSERRPSHSSSHHHAEDEEEEIFFEIPDFSVLAESIMDESQPIAKRMRSCFLLKQIGDLPSIEVLAKGLRSPSVLLAHECGYVLGQLQNKAALPFLRDVLADRTMNPIVRHECAEAMGAIGVMDSMDILVEYSTDPSEEVSETCQIAIERLKWNEANPGVVFDSKYASVDPAPRTDDKEQSIESIQREMMDKSKNMFERYRAMFALRDRGTEEAVLALATGFEDSSAVFRHEVAYVMGQIQHPAAVESLKKVSQTNRR